MEDEKERMVLEMNESKDEPIISPLQLIVLFGFFLSIVGWAMTLFFG